MAVLADHLRLSSCAAGPDSCDIVLNDFFMYRPGVLLPRLREWLPGIDKAAAPCSLSYKPHKAAALKRLAIDQALPFNNSVRVAATLSDVSGGIFDPLPEMARVHRGLFDAAWQRCQRPRPHETAAATVGAFAQGEATSGQPPSWTVVMNMVQNFCTTAGLFRLREMPASHFWAAMRTRARRLMEDVSEPAITHSHRAVDRDSTICLHLRGRSGVGERTSGGALNLFVRRGHSRAIPT